jgi:hypothetical protein
MPKELIASCIAIDWRSPDESPERLFPGAAAVA